MSSNPTPLRIYFDKSIAFSENRGDLSELIRPFWNTRTFDENIRIYGDFPKWLVQVSSLDEADLAALPMHWRYYQLTHQEEVGIQFANQARQHGKPLVIFATGDCKPHVPIKDAIILGTSLYRSRKQGSLFAMPPFFNDYVPGGDFSPRHKGTGKPVVGFCGQAFAPGYKLIAHSLRNALWTARDKLGTLLFESPPVVSHLYLRSRVLRKLAESKSVRSNFIIRDKYLGTSGMARLSPTQRDSIHQEFINNIVNSDYTVCVRGGGNFSKRLYETLCLGRIPIFVDTDCILPFDFAMDWRQYCVWIEESEIPFIGEKVATFHDRLSPQDFIDLQHACRNFWEEWLTLPRFYERFGMHLTCSEPTQDQS